MPSTKSNGPNPKPTKIQHLELAADGMKKAFTDFGKHLQKAAEKIMQAPGALMQPNVAHACSHCGGKPVVAAAAPGWGFYVGCENFQDAVTPGNEPSCPVGPVRVNGAEIDALAYWTVCHSPKPAPEAKPANLYTLYGVPEFNDLEKDSEGAPLVWHNHYSCDCGEHWSMGWSCACDDKCEMCGSSVEPHTSDWIGPDNLEGLWETLQAEDQAHKANATMFAPPDTGTKPGPLISDESHHIKFAAAAEVYVVAYNHDYNEWSEIYPSLYDAMLGIAKHMEITQAPNEDGFWDEVSDAYEDGKWKGLQVLKVNPTTMQIEGAYPGVGLVTDEPKTVTMTVCVSEKGGAFYSPSPWPLLYEVSVTDPNDEDAILRQIADIRYDELGFGDAEDGTQDSEIVDAIINKLELHFATAGKPATFKDWRD